jgi:hypothetical protein
MKPVVKRLLADSRVNPAAKENLAITMACDAGHDIIVR